MPTPEPTKLDTILQAIEKASSVVSLVIPGATLITGTISAIQAMRTLSDGTVEYVIILASGKAHLDSSDTNFNFVVDTVNAELARQGQAPIPK